MMKSSLDVVNSKNKVSEDEIDQAKEFLQDTANNLNVTINLFEDKLGKNKDYKKVSALNRYVKSSVLTSALEKNIDWEVLDQSVSSLLSGLLIDEIKKNGINAMIGESFFDSRYKLTKSEKEKELEAIKMYMKTQEEQFGKGSPMLSGFKNNNQSENKEEEKEKPSTDFSF